MNTAMGIVAKIVNVPHGLPLSALTTTSATTARRTIMIRSTVSSAVKPPTGPISSRAISPSDLPSRRIDAKRMTKSCTQPAEHRAEDDPQRARQVAELRRQRGADQRARPGDGREVVAEDDPLVGRLEVVAVAQPLGRRRPPVVEHHDLRGDELGVEAIADRVDADRRRHDPDAVDRFGAVERHDREGQRAQHRDDDPEPMAEQGLHAGHSCSEAGNDQAVSGQRSAAGYSHPFSRARRAASTRLCAPSLLMASER